MMRKWLLIGLAVVLLIGLGGMAGCGKEGIPGRYVNEDNSSEYLKLNRDGTFHLEEWGYEVDGEWEVDDGTLILRFDEGGTAGANIEEGVIHDWEGKVWKK